MNEISIGRRRSAGPGKFFFKIQFTLCKPGIFNYFDGILDEHCLDRVSLKSHRSGEASIESENTVRSGCASSLFLSMKIRMTA